MLDFDSYRELRSGERYNTNAVHTVSDNGSVEDNRADNSSKNTEEEVPETRILTQEAVNEQIKGFIAPPARQLEELTQLVQGMVTTPHSSHCPRIDYSIIYGTAAHQPDTEPSTPRKEKCHTPAMANPGPTLSQGRPREKSLMGSPLPSIVPVDVSVIVPISIMISSDIFCYLIKKTQKLVILDCFQT